MTSNKQQQTTDQSIPGIVEALAAPEPFIPWTGH